jgi:hypothetical protein
VRRLCCETGFLGKPIDPVFEDRELFADYLTAYYTDVEPEAAFVLEHEGVVKGYLLGSRRPLRHQWYGFFQNLRLFGHGNVFDTAATTRPRVASFVGFSKIPGASSRRAAPDGSLSF